MKFGGNVSPELELPIYLFVLEIKPMSWHKLWIAFWCLVWCSKHRNLRVRYRKNYITLKTKIYNQDSYSWPHEAKCYRWKTGFYLMIKSCCSYSQSDQLLSDPKKHFVCEVYFCQKKYIFDPDRSTNCAKSSFSVKIIYELPNFLPIIFVKYFINFTYHVQDYKVAGIIWH